MTGERQDVHSSYAQRKSFQEKPLLHIFKFLGWEIPPGPLNSYIYQIQTKGWQFWGPIFASLS